MHHMLRLARKILIISAVVALPLASSAWILTGMGNFLVRDDVPPSADAAVVLSTGIEYFPRLFEAADLYQRGIVDTVVINGNRRSAALRKLIARGYDPGDWSEGSLSMLELLGVPRDKVMAISAEDAYDTVSEARIVGAELLAQKISSVIITTSKSHTRRAGHIWENMFDDQLRVHAVAAKQDPYQPNGWWKDGRQAHLVLAEYGGWLYYLWKRLGSERRGNAPDDRELLAMNAS